MKHDVVKKRLEGDEQNSDIEDHESVYDGNPITYISDQSTDTNENTSGSMVDADTVEDPTKI